MSPRATNAAPAIAVNAATASWPPATCAGSAPGPTTMKSCRRPGVAAQLTGGPSGVIRRRADARIKRMTSRGTVRAIFNYTRDTGIEPEIYFYNPAHGAEGRRPGDDPREMTVHNGWDRATLFSLDREGFALRDFRSLFQRWDDDSAIPNPAAFVFPKTPFARCAHDRPFQPKLDGVRDRNEPAANTEVRLTHRWREPDSNHRSRRERDGRRERPRGRPSSSRETTCA